MTYLSMCSEEITDWIRSKDVLGEIELLIPSISRAECLSRLGIITNDKKGKVAWRMRAACDLLHSHSNSPSSLPGQGKD